MDKLKYNSFTVYKVKDGIYAAIVNKGMGAWGNAGIIDLGDQVIIFDTFASPQAAKDLRHAAEMITNKQITYVINSHPHFDHTFGNQVFKDVPIISSTTTRQTLMNTNLEAISQQIEPYLVHLKQQAERMINPLHKKEFYEDDIAEKITLKQNLSDIVLTLPTISFTNKCIINGSKKTAVLTSMGAGHSADDTILYIPEDKVLFSADLTTVDFHPLLGGGDLQNWKSSLSEMNKLDVDFLIPGHGPIGKQDAIGKLLSYIIDLTHFTHQHISNKGTLEDLLHLPLLAKYMDWNGYFIYEWNLESLYEQINSKNYSFTK